MSYSDIEVISNAQMDISYSIQEMLDNKLHCLIPPAMRLRHVAAGVAMLLVHCTGGAARAASGRLPTRAIRRWGATAARCRCAVLRDV